MKRNAKIGIGIAVGLLLAGGTFYYLHSQKAVLADAKKYLLGSAIQIDAASLDSKEDGFVIAWAKAAKRDEFFFSFRGDQFNVATGDKVTG